MLEEKDKELQGPVGDEKKPETTQEKRPEEKSTEKVDNTDTSGEPLTTEAELEAAKAEAQIGPTPEGTSSLPNAPEGVEEVASTEDQEAASTSETVAGVENTEEGNPPESEKDDTDEKVMDEIDEDNAEDAEDEDNQRRHHIPMPDYHAMSMENLVGELQRLVRNEKVQAIKKHVDGIKYEFDQKFQEFLEHKKEEFVANGGNEIDFRYNSVTKRQFNEVYSDYREKRDTYYRNLEKNLKSNLSNRLEIIEELKGLLNVQEDMNTTYKNFKELQERWRNAGPVPRTSYNDVWRTYHHHMENFYDFLHLNRDLRDLDFKHNLEEKQKLVERAEALGDEKDLQKAFRELQTLHKIWKEDIGPVDKEHREAIWERFSNATKVLHQRRQDEYKELEKRYEANLEQKNQIIAQINAIATAVSQNHKGLQQQIKQIEKLREAFFQAGKVPQRVNEATWSAFKESVRTFNRQKNAFYKNLKKEHQANLDKKRELVAIAVSLKDSEEWEMATPEMKRIQREWKTIGHVPRKYSDKIWKEFKAACNHYFDRLHNRKNKHHQEEKENLEKKEAILDELKAFDLSGNPETDLPKIQAFVRQWREHGRVPYNKKHIEGKFNKIIDALFKKSGVSKHESELLKYGNKIQRLADGEDPMAVQQERTFIKRKIDEAEGEIRQLENNLQFFSDASTDNPLVANVVNQLDEKKETLASWEGKLKKLNILKNDLNKQEQEVEAEGSDAEEE